MKAGSKKWISCMASVTLLSTVLFGCGPNNNGNNESAGTNKGTGSSSPATQTASGLDISKHVDLKLYMLGDAPKGLPEVEKSLNQLTEKDLNASIKFYYIPWTDWETKYKLLLTSGEDIDLIYTSGWTKLIQYAKDGAFTSLDEMLPTAAPDLYKFVPEEYWKDMKIGGKIYDIPNTWKQYQNDGIMWREDLREKYDLPEPTTIENLEIFMAGIKKNEPDMLPTAIDATSNLPSPWRVLNLKYPFYNQSYPNPDTGIAIMNDKPAEIVNYFESPMFADDVNMWKSWADQGFWSKSGLSDKTKSEDSFNNGKIAVMLGAVNGPVYGGTVAKLATSHPDWKLGYKTYSETTGVSHTPSALGNDGFAIPASSKNPERALAFYEKLVLDKEYNYLTEYGIEGTHYNISSDGYYEAIGDPSTSTFSREAMNGWAWRNPEFQLYDKSFEPVLTIFNNLDKISTPDVTSNFQFDDSAIKSEIAAFATVKAQYLAPMMAGLVPDVDAAIKTFLTKAKGAGLDKIQQAFTEQYKKYCEENNIQ